MDLRDKRITVIGLGSSGFAAACLSAEKGARVKVTDAAENADVENNASALKERGVEVETGGHSINFIKESDLCVVSPGVEDSSPPLKWATEFGIPVISELELGFRFCRGKIIAITGTNGKSTVTTLIGRILKAGNKDTIVCGNIGNPLSGEIGRIKETSWVVTEVSSFQLERVEEFKPHIAVILNITDDHLDRYRTFEDYFGEKLKVFRNQGQSDFLILNYDAPNLRPLEGMARSRVLFYGKAERACAAYVKDKEAIVLIGRKNMRLFPLSHVKLKGVHNVENVLASSLVGALAGVNGEDMARAVKNFKGLSHRFETVLSIDGVEYVDDSKGTTVDSTHRALESCEARVVLIAGGRDKRSDYSAVKKIIKEKVRALVLIGEAKDRIRHILEGEVDICDAGDMREAVRIASKKAKRGDMVLLSPMCSSFDMFKDYKHRGDLFKEAVRSLEKKGAPTP